MSEYTLHLGDCREVMAAMPANSVDSICTDPPYGLSSGPTKYLGDGGSGGFMGKDWDHGVPGVPFWEAALRVAKPGAILLAFGGTRTFHRLTVAIEDAGWEIRDCLMWLHSQGFPKGIAVDKAIDKHFGKEREVVGTKRAGIGRSSRGGAEFVNYVPVEEEKQVDITAPATPEAAQWQGWHSALKPAWEPIILAMKPLDGTYANNALTWNVAGLNIDATRIGLTPEDAEYTVARAGYRDGLDHISSAAADENGHVSSQVYGKYGARPHSKLGHVAQGRWPANLILDEAAAALLDEQSGERKSSGSYTRGVDVGNNVYGVGMGNQSAGTRKDDYADTGGASRFFQIVKDDEQLRFAYVAKASSRERNEGLQGMPATNSDAGLRGHIHNHKCLTCGGWEALRPNRPNQFVCQCSDPQWKPAPDIHNTHPTIKPISLMRWLCRLTKTPFGGVVLDPFCGSGSTGVAAVLEGRSFIGIDISAEYLAIAEARLAAASAQPFLFEVT